MGIAGLMENASDSCPLVNIRYAAMTTTMVRQQQLESSQVTTTRATRPPQL